MKFRKHILIPFLFVFTFAGFGQNSDTLVEINAGFDSILVSESFGMGRLFYKHKNDVLQNNLGVYGSPYYFALSNGLFECKLINEEYGVLNEVNKLTGVKPFTNITYINASRKEQIFEIQHAQKFGKSIVFNFGLNRISSPGVYRNQESNNTKFNGKLTYESKKGNYSTEFGFFMNRNFYEFNGGLANRNDFNQSLYDDERSYNVNLTSSNAFYKSYRYDVKQRIDLLGGESEHSNVFYFKHSISYENSQNVFFDNDPTSSIYSEIFLDSLSILSILQIDSVVNQDDSTRFNYMNFVSSGSTIDSTYRRTFSNTAHVGIRDKTYSFELFYQRDIKRYWQGFSIDTIQRKVDRNYHNDYLGTSFFLNRGSWNIEGVAMYALSGYRSADVRSEFILKKIFNWGESRINGGYFSAEPDLKEVEYISNHFTWDNDFEKQKVVKFDLQAHLTKPKLTFSAISKVVSNAIYYDSLAAPMQSGESISLTTLSLAKDYKLYKFYFRTALIYQLTSDKFIAPLPELVGRQIAYYQTRIFKKALKVQLGVGASYSTDYYGYDFMPATQEFYSQRNAVIGSYPTIDVFLNTYLKRAQIFLKYEHFNSGRNVHKAYATPFNPLLARSLKFGVSWNLFD